MPARAPEGYTARGHDDVVKVNNQFGSEDQMIPETTPFGEPRLPARAAFWMPELAEIDEEGIGFFRDVWTIIDVPRSEALDVIRREEALLSVVDGLATTAEDFDRLATILEGWDSDGTDEDGVSLAECSTLASAIGDVDSAELDGLELGVAGLVCALAAVGMVPAASCRGHVGNHPWSISPVIVFAADEVHARALEPLAREAGCLFGIDPARPELLLVTARSVVNLMRLAVAVIESEGLFVTQR